MERAGREAARAEAHAGRGAAAQLIIEGTRGAAAAAAAGGGGGSEWKLLPRHRVRTGDFGAQLGNWGAVPSGRARLGGGGCAEGLGGVVGGWGGAGTESPRKPGCVIAAIRPPLGLLPAAAAAGPRKDRAGG